MEWQFQAADARLALYARHGFLDALQQACTSESDCKSAEIAFGELVANVVRHAPGPIEITVESDAHGLVTLDVCDSGAGFVLMHSLPPRNSESGRGLFIVAQLCTNLSSTRLVSGNKVSVVLPVIAAVSDLHLADDKHAPGAPEECGMVEERPECRSLADGTQ
ncbi:MAG TPA: ATP-binding protein [Candidatus Baltobacteraceae bacterium]|jgi:anti-sigma regulatory factor (Ser/Thr protein kinase)